MERPATASAVPSWQNDVPPPQTLQWAAGAFGTTARVIRVEPLRGGGSHATHVLDIAAHGQSNRVVLRRWSRPRWQETDPEFTAHREATCLQLMQAAAIPAPRLICVDAEAAECDVPSVLGSYIAGSKLQALKATTITTLVQVLIRIHAAPVPPREAAGLGFTPYYELDRIEVPRWARDPGVWRSALALAAATPASADEATFLHRDYHPGNTLWLDGELTGVLDWDRGSVGSPAIDVAHMCLNLALHADDQRAAIAFAERYRERSGRAMRDLPWWQVRDALDVVPDVSDARGYQIAAALEGFVRSALSAAA